MIRNFREGLALVAIIVVTALALWSTIIWIWGTHTEDNFTRVLLLTWITVTLPVAFTLAECMSAPNKNIIR